MLWLFFCHYICLPLIEISTAVADDTLCKHVCSEHVGVSSPRECQREVSAPTISTAVADATLCKHVRSEHVGVSSPRECQREVSAPTLA